jgi:hypothetical protein
MNVFGFVDHIASAATTQLLSLQHIGTYRQQRNECVWLCSNKTWFTQTGSSKNWPVGPTVQTPALYQLPPWTGNPSLCNWWDRTNWSSFPTLNNFNSELPMPCLSECLFSWCPYFPCLKTLDLSWAGCLGLRNSSPGGLVQSHDFKWAENPKGTSEA